MGRPAEKWPTYALENLEDSLYRLKELERKASAVQDAIVLGDVPAALRDLSDVRVLALECVENLVRSRIGKYKQQEKASQKWNRSTEEKAAQAVNQVMATRRP
jgi:hypothetical protein